MKNGLNVLAVMCVILLSMGMEAFTQPSAQINPKYLNGQWDAWWITHPHASLYNYEVLNFRKTIELEKAPETFWVHVSADNRYRLFVNGTFVCLGPARGDLAHWFYETVDLAPYLHGGNNTIAAQVWNAGEYKPLAQISDKTGFIIQGDGQAEQIVNSDRSWKVSFNKAFNPLIYLDNDPRMNWAYYVAGVLDSVIAADYPWGWEQPGYDISGWSESRELDKPYPPGFNYHHKWGMTPRVVPLLDIEPQRFVRVARTEPRIDTRGFLDKKKEIVVPANANVVILFDNGQLGHGYPELTVSGGKNSHIAIRYAESFLKPDGTKGHRDSLQAKLIGVHDVFIPDGKEDRVFRPLWTRTFRWLQLEIATADEPLTIKDLAYESSQYPTKITAEFQSDDPMLGKIWDACIRTQEMSAQETFVSDLAWEQIQYVGDTKVQALAYLFLTGDDILFKLALKQFDESRVPSGLTQSRYPCNLVQLGPIYSLTWITMLYDYYMYGNDPEYVFQYLSDVNQVLEWFEKLETVDGILPLIPRTFVDWGYRNREREIRNLSETPGSAVHTLYYIYTLRQAEELFRRAGWDHEANECMNKIEYLSQNVWKQCYHPDLNLFVDSPGSALYSQHSNVMAELSGIIPYEQAEQTLMAHVLSDSILKVDMYYHFYLGRALRQAGLGDEYVATLDSWKTAIKNGMTTLGEAVNEPRSECHAWSTSPVVEFLSTICGIESTAPGFAAIEIKPSFNGLNHIRGSMSHPSGQIVVDLLKKKGGITGYVETPVGVPAVFEWEGKQIRLDGGKQEINLK